MTRFGTSTSRLSLSDGGLWPAEGATHGDRLASLEPWSEVSERSGIVVRHTKHGIDRRCANDKRLYGLTPKDFVDTWLLLRVRNSERRYTPARCIGRALIGRRSGARLRWEAVQRAASDGDLDLAVRESLALWLDGPQRPEGYVRGSARERMTDMVRRALSRLAATIKNDVPLDPPAADRLGELRVPSLVIRGDQDIPSVQTGCQVTASRIAGAEQAILRDTEHMVNLERPREFNSLVRDFLQRVL